jgi:hypothetical protein
MAMAYLAMFLALDERLARAERGFVYDLYFDCCQNNYHAISNSER